MKKPLFFIVLLTFGLASADNHHRQERGLLDEAERLLGHFHTGLGRLEATAREDLFPLAERVEQRVVRPAVQQLHGALDEMTQRIFGGINRNGQGPHEGQFDFFTLDNFSAPKIFSSFSQRRILWGSFFA